MDIADIASDKEDYLLKILIDKERSKQYSRIKPKGLCYYCEELLSLDTLFCSIYCRDDFDMETRIKNKQGITHAS